MNPGCVRLSRVRNVKDYFLIVIVIVLQLLLRELVGAQRRHSGLAKALLGLRGPSQEGPP